MSHAPNQLQWFICIIAKYCMKPTSFAHSRAFLFPHFWAIRLILSASGTPICLIACSTLLSKAYSNFSIIERSALDNTLLCTFLVTLNVKFINPRSSLFKTLNQTPRRREINLILDNSACRSPKTPLLLPIGLILYSSFPLSIFQRDTSESQFQSQKLSLGVISVTSHPYLYHMENCSTGTIKNWNFLFSEKFASSRKAHARGADYHSINQVVYSSARFYVNVQTSSVSAEMLRDLSIITDKKLLSQKCVIDARTPLSFKRHKICWYSVRYYHIFLHY